MVLLGRLGLRVSWNAHPNPHKNTLPAVKKSVLRPGLGECPSPYCNHAGSLPDIPGQTPETRGTAANKFRHPNLTPAQELPNISGPNRVYNSSKSDTEYMVYGV